MYVILTPTLVCNLACTYCYQKDAPTFSRMDADTEAASVAFVLRRVDEARTPKLLVHYIGGEVLTRKDYLLRTAAAFRAAMDARGGSFEWHLTTNGVDLDPPFVEAMRRFGEGMIKVTLDGDKDTHDHARVYRGGKGSFDVIFDNLVAVAGHLGGDPGQGDPSGRVRLWVGGNFYPGQEASYARLVDKLEDTGVAAKLEHIRFKPVVDTADNSCTSCGTAAKNEAETLIRLDRLVRSRRRSTVESKTVETMRGPCELHWDNSYIIDPDGDVFRCPALVGHADLAVGTVHGDAIAPAPLLELKPWETHAPCHDCAFLPVCMGGCLGGKYLQTGRRDLVACKKESFELSYADSVKRRYLDELGDAPWDGEGAPSSARPVEAPSSAP